MSEAQVEQAGEIVSGLCQDLDEPVIEYIAEIVANEREIDAKGIYETFGELLIRYDAAEDEADAQELSGLLATALQKQGIIEDYTSADAGATTVWVQANNSMRNQIKAGAKVQALYWEDSLYYNAVVKEVTQDRTFLVYFPDYDDEETTVSIQQLKIQQDVKAKSDKHGKVKKLDKPVKICEFGVEIRVKEEAPKLSEHGPSKRQLRKDAKEKKKAELEHQRERRRKERAEALKAKAMMQYLSLSHADKQKSKEIDIINYSMSTPDGSAELLQNATIKFVTGRRYGLIGRNGVGKTTLMREISNYEIPKFPIHVRVVHVEQEVVGDDTSVLDHVLRADIEREFLLKEEKRLLSKDDSDAVSEAEKDKNAAELEQIYGRMKDIDVWGAKGRAATILSGLGFEEKKQSMATKELSGGWRMRVSLACALFVNPDLLLLDEPTNHLDFPAVIWLEDYLNAYKKTLVVVSHDRNFVNNVITDVINFENRSLEYARGNYDTFEKVKAEKMAEQKKLYLANQMKRQHIREFIDKFRYNAKRATLVQSRIKALKRMEVIADVVEDPAFRFEFPEPDQLNKAVISCNDLKFGYNPKQILFSDFSSMVDMESRIGVLGANGAGKTTLINVLLGQLEALEGRVVLNGHARIATFSQHHVEQLKLHLTPVDNLCALFPKEHPQVLRRHLGAYGVSGDLALQKVSTLSGGQKSRVAFAIITYKKPHVIVMDEPTNHLDLETIEALILAVNAFGGGILAVSHDQHFLQSVCNEFWSVARGCVKRHVEFKDAKKWTFGNLK